MVINEKKFKKAVWLYLKKKINEKKNWPASSPTQAWSPSGI
jgi:hypothetical protein